MGKGPTLSCNDEERVGEQVQTPGSRAPSGPSSLPPHPLPSNPSLSASRALTSPSPPLPLTHPGVSSSWDPSVHVHGCIPFIHLLPRAVDNLPALPFLSTLPSCLDTHLGSEWQLVRQGRTQGKAPRTQDPLPSPWGFWEESGPYSTLLEGN